MDNVLEHRKERLDDLLVDVAELRELVSRLEKERVYYKTSSEQFQVLVKQFGEDNKKLRECLKDIEDTAKQLGIMSIQQITRYALKELEQTE